MKKEKILLLQEILATQMNYWTFFPLMFTIYLFLSKASAPSPLLTVSFLVLSFLPLFYYFVRCYIAGVIPTFVLHVGPVALLWFLPFESLIPKVLCMVLGGGFLIYSLYLRITYEDCEDDHLPPIAPVVISGGCMFLQNYLGINRCKAVYPILLIYVLSLFFLLFFISKYFHFLEVNESSASHIPAEAIFHSGIRQVLVFTLCGAFVLLLSSGIAWLEKPLSLLKASLVAFLRFVFRFVHIAEETEVETPEYLPSNPGSIETYYAETGDSFWLWDLLIYLISFAMAVFLFIVFVKLLKQVFGYLKYKVNTLFLDEEETEEDAEEPDFRERLHGYGRKKKPLFSFLSFLSNNEKIRRLYRKQAERLNADAARLRRVTARECATFMSAPVMGDVYEKARYSGEDCTSEDIRKMKAACRKAEVPGERI